MFAAINPIWFFTVIIVVWGLGIGSVVALFYGLINFKTNMGQGCIVISCAILLLYFLILTS